MRATGIAFVVGITAYILAMLYGVWGDFQQDRDKYDNISFVQTKLKQITQISRVVVELQRERGLSSIYLTSKNKHYAELLQAQRDSVARIVKDGVNIGIDIDLTSELKTLHHNIDYKYTDSLKSYTDLIEKLRTLSGKLIFDTNDEVIKNSLILFGYLDRAQEYAGRLRASIGSAIASDQLLDSVYIDIISQNTILQDSIFFIKQHPEAFGEDLLVSMLQRECLQDFSQTIESISKTRVISKKYTAIEWYTLSTCAINMYYASSSRYLKQISEYTSQIRHESIILSIKHLIFWIAALLVSSIALFMVFVRTKELYIKRKLLESYKEAIDRSAIVSKTDMSGVITYANEAFCNISGYNKNELIGQHHSIVRHPDTSKKIFETLWRDIKQGRSWQGVIQNQKKNGSAYWVEATVSPVYNEKGQLSEYMAIRHDITDIVLLGKEVQSTQREMIYRLGEAVESRSKESGLHIKRVALYSRLLAYLAELSEQECETISVASTMHDVGKIAIADSILLKNGKLNKEEKELMKKHPKLGYDILKGSNQPLLKMAADIAYQHHEHYDGNGYPRGLKGENISIYGRIVAIADVFDALSTDRSYKKAWAINSVFDFIQSQSGKQFDPRLVRLLLEHCDQFVAIKYEYED